MALIDFKMSFRYTKSRVMFSENAPSWSTCMDKCLMYSEARAPSFSTQAEPDNILAWAKTTITDPSTMKSYPTFLLLPFFWIAYRLQFAF